MTKLRFELRQSVSGVCSHNHWANCLSVNHTYTWGEKSMTFMIFHRRVSFERYIYSNRLYGTHGTITTHHIANNLITTQPRHHVCPHHTSPSTTPLSTTRFTAAIAHRHHHQSPPLLPLISAFGFLSSDFPGPSAPRKCSASSHLGALPYAPARKTGSSLICLAPLCLCNSCVSLKS